MEPRLVMSRWWWLAFVLVVVWAVAVLGWEPSPWQGHVRVCCSQVDRVTLPHEEGMKVRDALARSRHRLGDHDSSSVSVYRWRVWLPERIFDAAVMSGQCALGAAGLHGWSDRLWQWWDGIVPRQEPWQRVRCDGDAGEWPLAPGELVVLGSRH